MLGAHTNAVGHHVLNEWRYNRTVGKVYDYNTDSWVDIDRTDRSYLIPVATSDKPPTVWWGDHHTAYDYSRGVCRVTSDVPMEHRVSWYNPIDGKTASYDWVETTHISGSHTPFSYWPGVSALERDNMWNRTKTTALNNLVSQKASIGAALAEARQTVDMFSDAVIAGASYLNAFKRGNLRKLWRQQRGRADGGRAAANAWLEYHYGWKPLAQDIYSAQEQVHRDLAKGLGINATGSAIKTGSGEHEVRDETQTVNWRHSAVCHLHAVLDNPSATYLNSFGLINPLSIAWEVVPFSFAVDWIMPVGKTLEACTATVGLSFKGGRIVEHRTYSLSGRAKPGRRTAWRVCENVGDYREEGFGFQRTALSAFPIPQFYGDDTPYSTPRALNAIALMRQLS